VREWDVFISHASEDKRAVVEPLVRALQETGLRVWYDKFSLSVGDRLRRSIDEGLRLSRFGIVVLSPHFFRKHWPQVELDGLAQREVGGTKVVLPIWVDLTYDDVRKESLTLADRIAAQWKDGIDEVVRQLVAVIGTPDGRDASPSMGTAHDELVLVMSPDNKSAFLTAQEVTLGEELHLTVAARDAEEAAFLANLRGVRGQNVAVAYGTSAELGKLANITRTRRGSSDVWILTLKELSTRFSESLSEMSYNGITSDEIAEMRVRRILLNERLKKKEAFQDAMLESFVRGHSSAIQVHESPFPRLFADAQGNKFLFVPAARLLAVLMLRLSDSIEHILDLQLTLRNDILDVRFRGKRARRYSNVEPPVITVTGTCKLV
jgi:hypothetical protein